MQNINNDQNGNDVLQDLIYLYASVLPIMTASHHHLAKLCHGMMVNALEQLSLVYQYLNSQISLYKYKK